MKRIYSLILLSAAILVSAAAAQDEIEFTKPNPVNAMKIAFSSTDDLLAQGWEQAGPEIWRKTLADGAEAEIALGRAAYERMRAALNADIKTLQDMENLEAEQELKLFELLLRREKLEESEPSTKASSSAMLCGGNAAFNHVYGYWQNNPVYPSAQARSTFINEHQPGATAYVYASATMCTGSCVTTTASDSGSGFLVSAQTSPAIGLGWSCSASAYGSVQVVGCSSGGSTYAWFSSSWNC